MPLPLVSVQRKPDAPPGAFEDDVKFLAEIGVRSIVAALDIPRHREIFQRCGFHYLSLQVPDGLPPTVEQADRLLAFYQISPKPLIAHCEGGIGRTATLLALILLRQGLSAQAAVRAVKTVMPPALEISQQVEFISKYEKRLKSRTADRD